jgi:hypothetical protein
MVKLNPLRWFEKPEPAKPKTFDSKVSGTKHAFYDPRKKDLAKNRRIYEQGGLVSEAVDCHPLFMFSNGYKFDGPEALVKSVQEQHDNIDFETVAWKVITDALVVEKGVAEIAPSRDGKTPVAALYYRPGEQFEEVYDDAARIVGYRQVVMSGGMRKVYDIDPEYIFRLDLGLPLISRCKDDILRDTEVADATTKSIARHGFPRYHIKVGTSGETIPNTIISTLANEFEELKADHEWVTPRDVDISNIDSTGVVNTKLYGDWSIQRLCAGLGTPEEMLGLGRGSTEATANVRLQAWYDRVATLQRRFAAQWNTQIVDRMTGKDGLVKLVFGDPSPADDLARANVVVALLSPGAGMNPVITINEARAMMGLKPIDESDLMYVPPAPQEPDEPGADEEEPGGEQAREEGFDVTKLAAGQQPPKKRRPTHKRAKRR